MSDGFDIVTTQELPLASRGDRPTRCDRCGEPITDETFILGFLADNRYLLLHKHCPGPVKPDVPH